MNWLAHVLLSEEHIDFKIGNYLADPLKGKSWPNASIHLIKGMHVHKIIDSYTDSHSQFKISKNRLKEKGLLKAIIIDITYDYLLSKNWNKFCNISMSEYTKDFYIHAKKRKEFLSIKATESLNRFITNDVLNKYNNLEDLKIAFEKLDLRLSSKLLSRDNASSYYLLVKNNIKDLEKDFLIFFPTLVEEVKKHVQINKIKHLKF